MEKNLSDVVIIGGGAAGTITAMALAESSHKALSVAVIENAAEPGRGVAYSTPYPQHLLNVPAGKMSALPHDTSHFARWLSQTPEFSGQAVESLEKLFVPRHLYGRYLHNHFKLSGAVHIQKECVNVEKSGDHFVLKLEPAGSVQAKCVILALGHGAPHVPGPFRNVVSAPGFLPHPWDFALARKLASGARHVFILGTGLTMVDCVLSLKIDGWNGKITALSRHGLLPHGHVPAPAMPFPIAETANTLAGKLNSFRKKIAEIETTPWQSHFDALRPRTQSMWRELPEKEKKQFLRHLRPLWEVHRHRMAPQVYAEIQSTLKSGQLEIRGGRVQSCQATEGGFELTFENRRQGEIVQIQPQVIINATGPLGDVKTDGRPLLRNLLDQKLISAHPLAMGIQVSENLQALEASGSPVQGLYALAGLTRGWGWEVTAVPDIREQAWALGRLLSQRVQSGSSR